MVAFDPASGELRPFQDVMFRRRKYASPRRCATSPSACSASSCCMPTAPTSPACPIPGPAAGPPGRGRHRVSLAAAGHRRTADDERALKRVFEQAVAKGCDGLICKSLDPAASIRRVHGASSGSSSSVTTTELTDILDLVMVVDIVG